MSKKAPKKIGNDKKKKSDCVKQYCDNKKVISLLSKPTLFFQRKKQAKIKTIIEAIIEIFLGLHIKTIIKGAIILKIISR